MSQSIASAFILGLVAQSTITCALYILKRHYNTLLFYRKPILLLMLLVSTFLFEVGQLFALVTSQGACQFSSSFTAIAENAAKIFASSLIMWKILDHAECTGENYLFRAWGVARIGLAVVNVTLTRTTNIPQCYPQSAVLPSLASVFTDLALDIYFLVRLSVLLNRTTTEERRIDHHVVFVAISLMLFHMMAIIPDFNLLVLSLRIIPQTLSLLVLIVLFTFSQELVVPKRRDLTISIPESSPRVLETIISSRPNFSGAASHKSFDIARTPVLVLPNKSWATARKSLSVASLGTICHSGTSPSLSSTSKKCDCHPSTPSIPLLKSVKTTDPEVERSYSSKFAHYRKTFPGAVLSPLTGPPKVNAAYSHSLHRSWCSTDSVSKKGSDEFDLECLPSAKSSVFLKTSFKRSRKILNLMTCHMYDQTNHQSFSQSSKSLPSSFNLPNNFSSQKFETIQESSPEPSPVSDIDFSIETASMLLFPGSPCAKYLQCTLSDISVASSNFSRSSTHIWDKMKRISLENKNLETNFVGLIGGPPYLGALASRKFQQYVDSLSERSENALSSIAASTPFTSRERENQLHLKTGLWARPETLGTGSSLWTRTDHLWKMRRVSLIERSLVMFDRYSMRGSRTVVEPAEVLGTLWRPPSVATASQHGLWMPQMSRTFTAHTWEPARAEIRHIIWDSLAFQQRSLYHGTKRHRQTTTSFLESFCRRKGPGYRGKFHLLAVTLSSDAPIERKNIFLWNSGKTKQSQTLIRVLKGPHETGTSKQLSFFRRNQQLKCGKIMKAIGCALYIRRYMNADQRHFIEIIWRPNDMCSWLQKVGSRIRATASVNLQEPASQLWTLRTPIKCGCPLCSKHYFLYEHDVCQKIVESTCYFSRNFHSNKSTVTYELKLFSTDTLWKCSLIQKDQDIELSLSKPTGTMDTKLWRRSEVFLEPGERSNSTPIQASTFAFEEFSIEQSDKRMQEFPEFDLQEASSDPFWREHSTRDRISWADFLSEEITTMNENNTCSGLGARSYFLSSNNKLSNERYPDESEHHSIISVGSELSYIFPSSPIDSPLSLDSNCSDDSGILNIKFANEHLDLLIWELRSVFDELSDWEEDLQDFNETATLGILRSGTNINIPKIRITYYDAEDHLLPSGEYRIEEIANGGCTTEL